MSQLYFYLGVIVLSFILMMWGKAYDEKNVDLVGKMGASIFVLAIAIYAYINVPMKLGITIVIAMIFGSIGDLALGLKDHPSIKKQKNKDLCFMIGLAAFFIGHIFYMIMFVGSFTFESYQLVIAFLASLLLPVIIYFLSKKEVIDFDGNTIPCMAYGYLLTSLVLVTGFIALNLRTIYGISIFVSAILFITSDLILMVIYFGKKDLTKEKKYWLDFFNLLTYFMAQIGFVTVPLYLGNL